MACDSKINSNGRGELHPPRCLHADNNVTECGEHWAQAFQFTSIVNKLCTSHSISIACLLETKLYKARVGIFTSSRFPGWGSCTNNNFIDGGRMLILWDGSRVNCEVLEIDSQHIHLKATCKVTQVSFMVTFVYPVYSIAERKKLWDHLTLVWLCKAFKWMALGLEDAPSMGSFFTWTNGSIWSKLDRVLMNNVWSSLDLTCSASFLPMEPVSDHCPAKEANAAFKEAVQAHMDDPLNVTLKLKCHELRERANFLSENLTSYHRPRNPGWDVCRAVREFIVTGSVEELETHSAAPLTRGHGDCSRRPMSFADMSKETFEGVSGLSFNPTKSSIFLAGMYFDRKKHLEAGFLEGLSSHLYLGIPLAPTSVSVKDFSPFTDAIDQFIQKWGHHTLSYAGKLGVVGGMSTLESAIKVDQEEAWRQSVRGEGRYPLLFVLQLNEIWRSRNRAARSKSTSPEVRSNNCPSFTFPFTVASIDSSGTPKMSSRLSISSISPILETFGRGVE
ncbi:hypothetical protein Leryth_021637 [Lithospermum erythrorhizon]|nr:hypothetical protein Leryth_021637 [Lithospermum erythrorhizon]